MSIYVVSVYTINPFKHIYCVMFIQVYKNLMLMHLVNLNSDLLNANFSKLFCDKNTLNFLSRKYVYNLYIFRKKNEEVFDIFKDELISLYLIF